MPSASPTTLDTTSARRLALARAGLLKPEWAGFPGRASGRGGGVRARRAVHAIIERVGYLQLDTVCVAGARSHALVPLSRLDGLHADLPETLLRPDEPLFEYWGHEVCWMPLDLWPALAFRRKAFRSHPWWGDLVGQHPDVAKRLLRRIRDEGPLRSVDMEGKGGAGWWNLKLTKRVATALWSSGELAIRERRAFQRTYDLAERVIPADVRACPALPEPRALEVLLARALSGHGWATTGTLAQTWRLRNRRPAIDAALGRLEARGEIVRCALVDDDGRRTAGWARPADLELADRLRRVRPRPDRGVLLSPFDPVLWDRSRVARLFGFDQVLEIFKPQPQRTYGYYCLPVLAGDRLVARFDLKAERARGRLRVVSVRFEGTGSRRPARPADGEAARAALVRLAGSLGLEPVGWRAAEPARRRTRQSSSPSSRSPESPAPSSAGDGARGEPTTPSST